jgi:hypothetical protein
MIDELLPKVVGVDMSFLPTVGYDRGFFIDSSDSSEFSIADSDDASEDSDDYTSNSNDDE